MFFHRPHSMLHFWLTFSQSHGQLWWQSDCVDMYTKRGLKVLFEASRNWANLQKQPSPPPPPPPLQSSADMVQILVPSLTLPSPPSLLPSPLLTHARPLAAP